MTRLGKAVASDTYRFCFFIDGLDEYEGDSSDYVDLVQLISEWGSSKSLKVICSARP
jgi:hypothetical protein